MLLSTGISTWRHHRHIKYDKWKIRLSILIYSSTNLRVILSFYFYFTYHIQYIISLIYCVT